MHSPLKSCLSVRVGRISESESVERSKRRTDLTVFTARKGAIGKNGMRRKGVRKRNAADEAPLAVTDGTMGPWCGWLSCRGRAESIKSNVWWRYNEMNLCRAVMLEYLATLFWFCFWPSRHPSRYTVFELNSTTGRSLQERRSNPTHRGSRHSCEIFLKRYVSAGFSTRQIF